MLRFILFTVALIFKEDFVCGNEYSFLIEKKELISTNLKVVGMSRTTTSTTNQRPIFTTSKLRYLSSWILLDDRIQKTQGKLTLVKMFLMLLGNLQSQQNWHSLAVQLQLHSWFGDGLFLVDANSSTHIFCQLPGHFMQLGSYQHTQH